MTDTTSRPLRRSSTDRVLGGVAGGLGRHVGIDPVLVRIGFALTVFLGGIGFVAYLLAWVLMPLDDPDDPSAPARRPWIGQRDAARVLGAVLVFVAVGHLLAHFWWAGDLFLPVALIAAGAWLIFRPDSPDDTGAQHQALETVDGPGAQHQARETPPVPPPPRKRDPDPGFPTARATTGVVALLAGGLWFASNAGADISLEAGLIACLAVCGLGLVAGAFLGRGRALIGLSAPLVIALVAVSAIDIPLAGGVGDRSYSPSSVSALEDEYRLGVGELVLDLRGLRADELVDRTTRIEASIGMGSLQVLVSRDISVIGTARAQLGDVDIAGESSSGTDAERRIDLVGDEGAPVIELDLRVGVGEVRVR